MAPATTEIGELSARFELLYELDHPVSLQITISRAINKDAQIQVALRYNNEYCLYI